MMRASALVLVTMFAFAGAPAALAQSEEPKSPSEHLDGAMQEIMGVLRFVLRAIPQYEMPEVMPNGDIIIRRVQPDDESEEGREGAPSPPPTAPPPVERDDGANPEVRT